MTSIAFDEQMGLQLKPLLGSDIAHFDVIDATEVLDEAYELVEDGHITERELPRVHVLERGAAVPGHEPVVLHRYRRRGRCGRRVRRSTRGATGELRDHRRRAARSRRVHPARTGPRC